MDAEIYGHDEANCGVEVTDENNYLHSVLVNWNGDIDGHYVDEYPHDPDDRTEEEQRIMSQVEERARYEAQQEFPEADILDPMWDPEHIDRGIEALVNHPLEQFHEEFRDFYEALDDPVAYLGESYDGVEDDSFTITKSYTLSPDDRIEVVDDVSISYRRTDGTAQRVGPFREPGEGVVVCGMPWLEFNDDYNFEEEFHDLVVTHLLAQIRDIYFHMGEEPPDEYKVQGIGKRDIHGDGIGET